MNMKNIIGLALGDLLEHIEEDLNTVKDPIGTISEELRQEIKNIHRDRSYLRDEKEIKIEELAREAKRTISELFDDREEELQDRHDAMWNKIYAEIGAEPSKSGYSVNPRTGVVSRKIKKGTDPFKIRPL